MKTNSPLISRARASAVFLFTLLAVFSAPTLRESVANPVVEEPCVVTARLVDDVSLNAMDLELDYDDAAGEFEGEAASVTCVRGAAGLSISFRDEDSQRFVRASLVRIPAFSGPIDLLACRFLHTGVEPLAEDFSVRVTEAARVEGDNEVPVRPFPSVVVSDVSCPGQLPGGLTTTTTSTTSTTMIGQGGSCGFPVSSGATPTATDALFTLQAAVGDVMCALCECDTDDSGDVLAGDALTVLRASVDLDVDLDCPPCS